MAVAVNSLVMPDVRDIDRTLAAIRASLRPGGVFLGVLPAMDAIHYHTMLLIDEALDRGLDPEEAERHAAFQAEHHFYEFAFGRFGFQGLRQKFWQPFEIRAPVRQGRLRRVELDKVLYPWDDTITGGPAFADHPRSWDWSFRARSPVEADPALPLIATERPMAPDHPSSGPRNSRSRRGSTSSSRTTRRGRPAPAVVPGLPPRDRPPPRSRRWSRRSSGRSGPWSSSARRRPGHRRRERRSIPQGGIAPAWCSGWRFPGIRTTGGSPCALATGRTRSRWSGA